jgi:hypothetical protein
MPHRTGPDQPRRAVRVLAVSDVPDEGLRADLRPVASAELILACGDLPFDYLSYLMNALDIPLAFVPGNHDPDLAGYRLSRAGLTLRAGLPAQPPWPAGAVNVDGAVTDVGGLRIAGLGGCLRYREGPNQYTDSQQARRAWRLRAAARRAQWRDHRQVDVLLTHAPPLGVGDGPDPAHRGFRAYRGLTAALRPGLLLHGHVHPVVPVPSRDRPCRPPEEGEPAGAVLPWSSGSGQTIVRNIAGRHLLDVTANGGHSHAR